MRLVSRRVAADGDLGLPDVRDGLVEMGFDFAQLDAEPTDFHLRVPSGR